MENGISFRDLAKQVAFCRVGEIVGNLHRNAYDRAATVAVALAEALQLSGDSASALAIPRELTRAKPRYFPEKCSA